MTQEELDIHLGTVVTELNVCAGTCTEIWSQTFGYNPITGETDTVWSDLSTRLFNEDLEAGPAGLAQALIPWHSILPDATEAQLGSLRALLIDIGDSLLREYVAMEGWRAWSEEPWSPMVAQALYQLQAEADLLDRLGSIVGGMRRALRRAG